MWGIMFFSMSLLSLALSVELQAVKEYHSSIIQKSEISNRQADLVYQKISKKTTKEALAEKIYGNKDRIDRIATLSYSTNTEHISNRNKKIASSQLIKKDDLIRKPIVLSVIKDTIKQRINIANENRARRIMSGVSEIAPSHHLGQQRQNHSLADNSTNIQDTVRSRVNSFLSTGENLRAELTQHFSTDEENLRAELTQHFSTGGNFRYGYSRQNSTRNSHAFNILN